MKADLDATFVCLRKLISEYDGRLTVRTDQPGRYELWSVKDITVAGRHKKEIFFAGAIIQSSYVGFYFMPVYIEAQIADVFEPELRKLLKGKSCFHI